MKGIAAFVFALGAFLLLVNRRDGATAPVLWVADRARGRILGLDRRLRTRVDLVVASPERLVATKDGALWCISQRGARSELLRLDPEGPAVDAFALPRAALVATFGQVLDLDTLSDGSALVLESEALWQVDGGGTRRRLLRMPGARSLAVSDARILVTGLSGRSVVVGLRGRPAVIARLSYPGEILATASAPVGGWWLLEAPGGEGRPTARLVFLDPGGGERWSRSVDGNPCQLSAAESGVWVADGETATLSFYDREAELTRRVELAPAWAAPRCVRAMGARLLVATSGALGVLSDEGRWVGSQGGFSELTAVVPAGP